MDESIAVPVAWGKFQDGHLHRLVHHSADVAACFEVLASLPTIRASMERAAGTSLSPEIVIRLATLAFLHDAGKLHPGFHGVAIDHAGVTRDFPAQSLLTGLLANALGWARTEWEKHQALQDRLVFAARRDRGEGAGPLTDVQNARLEKIDKGWRTWGEPEGRDGASYGARHRRRRDYHMDARAMVALRLEPEKAGPNLDAIAAALERPARPLFIGGKPCLPSAPLLWPRFAIAPNAHVALLRVESRQRARDKNAGDLAGRRRPGGWQGRLPHYRRARSA